MCRVAGWLSIAVSCILVQSAHAQSFRTPQRPPQAAPIRPSTPTAFRNFFPTQPFISTGFNSFGAFPIVPAAQARFVRGNFNNGVFTPSAFGPFLLSSRGGFEPVQGSFVPAIGGPFTLTTRGSVNPQTGNFVPSPAGGIVLRERGVLTPSVGSFTQARGSFNPFTGAFMPSTNAISNLSSNGVFVPSTARSFPPRSVTSCSPREAPLIL